MVSSEKTILNTLPYRAIIMRCIIPRVPLHSTFGLISLCPGLCARCPSRASQSTGFIGCAEIIRFYLLDTVTVLFFGACENTPRNNLRNTRKQKVTILILKFVDIFFFRFLSFFLFYNSCFSRISGIRNPINHQNEKRPLRKPSMKYCCPFAVTYVVMRSMVP